jgi:hypothetical protein
MGGRVLVGVDMPRCASIAIAAMAAAVIHGLAPDWR